MIKIILKRVKSHIFFLNKVPKCALHQGALFIHIPKAAGSKVSFDLYGAQIGHHKAVSYYLNDYSNFKSIPTFSIVRNPIDRFISAYNFLKNGGMSKIDSIFNEEVLSKYNDINDFIKNEVNKSSFRLSDVPHFEPQFEYLYYNSTLLVDFVFKLENLSQDNNINDVFPMINELDFSKRANATKGKGYTFKDLNSESVSILKNFYYKDYEVFGYEK